MEMVSLTYYLSENVFKTSSLKYRTLNSIINNVEQSKIFGNNGVLPKSISKDVYLKLSNYVDDVIVNSFLSQDNGLKININGGDPYSYTTLTEVVKENVVEIVVDEATGEEKEVKKVVSKNVSKEVSYEYISFLADFGKDEKFLDLVDEMLAKKDSFSLMVGEDLITHPNAENLAKLCGLVDKCTEFDVVIIPSQTNTLGVAQICTLSKELSNAIIYLFSLSVNPLTAFTNSRLFILLSTITCGHVSCINAVQNL